MSECAAALISDSLPLTNLSAKKDSVISTKFVDKGELIDSEKPFSHSRTAQSDGGLVASVTSFHSYKDQICDIKSFTCSLMCMFKAWTTAAKNMPNNSRHDMKAPLRPIH